MAALLTFIHLKFLMNEFIKGIAASVIDHIAQRIAEKLIYPHIDKFLDKIFGEDNKKQIKTDSVNSGIRFIIFFIIMK